MAYWIYIIIALAGLLIIAVIVILIIFFVRRKKITNNNDNQKDDNTLTYLPNDDNVHLETNAIPTSEYSSGREVSRQLSKNSFPPVQYYAFNDETLSQNPSDDKVQYHAFDEVDKALAQNK